MRAGGIASGMRAGPGAGLCLGAGEGAASPLRIRRTGARGSGRLVLQGHVFPRRPRASSGIGTHTTGACTSEAQAPCAEGRGAVTPAVVAWLRPGACRPTRAGVRWRARGAGCGKPGRRLPPPLGPEPCEAGLRSHGAPAAAGARVRGAAASAARPQRPPARSAAARPALPRLPRPRTPPAPARCEPRAPRRSVSVPGQERAVPRRLPVPRPGPPARRCPGPAAPDPAPRPRAGGGPPSPGSDQGRHPGRACPPRRLRARGRRGKVCAPGRPPAPRLCCGPRGAQDGAPAALSPPPAPSSRAHAAPGPGGEPRPPCVLRRRQLSPVPPAPTCPRPASRAEAAPPPQLPARRRTRARSHLSERHMSPGLRGTSPCGGSGRGRQTLSQRAADARGEGGRLRDPPRSCRSC